MTITLPVAPQEEAKLLAIAETKGLSVEAFVHEVMEKMLAQVADILPKKEPTHGKHDVRVDTVPEPQIQAAGDVIIRVTSTAICRSDVHL
jgi:D-arabinose 1-dehydrogenase-like Zn-dependent alcohol dehydrogenase